ncbi:hypothetical protein NL676_004574 [Syzygium grande]|nr:hypothetical protein NL676_004574 [Syzygium grande]
MEIPEVASVSDHSLSSRHNSHSVLAHPEQGRSKVKPAEALDALRAETMAIPDTYVTGHGNINTLLQTDSNQSHAEQLEHKHTLETS